MRFMEQAKNGKNNENIIISKVATIIYIILHTRVSQMLLSEVTYIAFNVHIYIFISSSCSWESNLWPWCC